MDLRPGVDLALLDDGRRRVDCVAARWLAAAAVALLHATTAQRRVDAGVFWCAGDRLGAGGDRGAVDDHSVHAAGVPARQQRGGGDAGAVFGVGFLRLCPELDAVADESGVIK